MGRWYSSERTRQTPRSASFSRRLRAATRVAGAGVPAESGSPIVTIMVISAGFPERPTRTLGFILVLIALLTTSVTARAQYSPSLEGGHYFWEFKENAPQGALALAQTSDGFLWFGTPTGLYRFDGTRFELYHSPFGDELLSTNVSHLLALPSGGLWI